MCHLLSRALVLAALFSGVPAQRRSIERISSFETGIEGWRILPSLPSSDDLAGERVVLPVSADSSPSYLLAPNELVSQIKAAAARRPVPDVAVRVALEVPPDCRTADGWRCSFRFAVVGKECSLTRTFLPSSPHLSGSTTTMLEANLTWWLHAPLDARDWEFCSEILYPDGSVPPPHQLYMSLSSCDPSCLTHYTGY